MTLLRKLKNSVFPDYISAEEPMCDQPFHSSTVVRRVQEALARGQSVGLIYLDLVRFREVEQAVGPHVAADVVAAVGETLRTRFTTPPINTRAYLQNLWGDDFVVYVCYPAPPAPGVLERLAFSVLNEVEGRVRSLFPQIANLRLHWSHGLIQDKQGNLSSQICQAIQRAMEAAKSVVQLESEARLQAFDGLIEGNRLIAVYQPIVSLKTGMAFGWESLIRGPQGSEFRTPDALFGFAEETGRMWMLDRACRRAAIEGLPRLTPDQKVFLNVNPQSIKDPRFIQGETMSLIRQRQLQPHNVVFEITERQSIQDFEAFRRTLEHYRSQGYLIAIDDLGAGYSSLQSIAELRPDFIKLDMSLIKGIHMSAVRQTMVETLVTFAQRVGCTLIAEGTETREELQALSRLGVGLAQGYYLGVPERIPRPPSREALDVITGMVSVPNPPAFGQPIAGLLEPGAVVPPDTLVRTVAELLKADPSREGIVVLDEDRPVGLVQRDRLFRHLGVPFGPALHHARPITGMMDREFLCVESHANVDQVARHVLARAAERRYDPVIAMEGGRYAGTLSVHQLLYLLAEATLTALVQSVPRR